MKYSIITLVLAGILGMECFAQKAKKVSYDFPEAMKENVRAEFTKQCDKGQILYNINCAKCHNTTEKGKQVIPDFLPEQLIGYELRVKNPQHESDLPETNVTPEELGQIMTFLNYKKKNKPAK